MTMYSRQFRVVLWSSFTAMLLFAAWLFWRPVQAPHKADETRRPAAAANSAAKLENSALLSGEIDKTKADEGGDEQKTQIDAGPLDDNAAIVESFRAGSVREVLRLAEQAAAEGNERLARILRSRADLACHDLTYGDLLNYHNPNLFGINQLQTYCEGYYSANTEKPDLTYIDELLIIKNDVVGQLATLDVEAGREKLLDLIVDADNPMVLDGIEAALGMLLRREQQYAFDLGQNAIFKDDAKLLLYQTDAQHDLIKRAIDIYSCYKFQGCGPRTYKSIEICVTMKAICQSQITYIDFINLTSTEITRRQIDAILATISSHESGR